MHTHTFEYKTLKKEKLTKFMKHCKWQKAKKDRKNQKAVF